MLLGARRSSKGSKTRRPYRFALHDPLPKRSAEQLDGKGKTKTRSVWIASAVLNFILGAPAWALPRETYFGGGTDLDPKRLLIWAAMWAALTVALAVISCEREDVGVAGQNCAKVLLGSVTMSLPLALLGAVVYWVFA